MEKEFTSLMMAVLTLVDGKMANNMEWVSPCSLTRRLSSKTLKLASVRKDLTLKLLRPSLSKL